MKLIMQPTPETCGQACIAMIAERPIEALEFFCGGRSQLK